MTSRRTPIIVHQVRTPACLTEDGGGDDLFDDIFDETIPRQMYEALEEELQTTKSELNVLTTRLEQKDADIVNGCSDLARAKSEKNQLNEVAGLRGWAWGKQRVVQRCQHEHQCMRYILVM